jgi:hypothetical protein
MCTRAVSGLAHYIEREGVPTVAITLIRHHAASVAPPRALFVPFELGRPFGAPDEPEFQHRVLGAALALLERTDGPLLVDFPDPPPEPGADLAPWSAPIEAAPRPGDPHDADAVAQAVRSEIEKLRPFRDQWVRDHGGRQLDRITSLGLDDIVDLIQGYTRDQSIDNPMPAFPTERTVKFAADDLKHFYYQAALSRPGRITDIALDNWFFGETLAGGLLLSLKAALLLSDDAELRTFGERSLVPSHQAHRG